ncbi:MAG: MaoC family dehydratase [Aquabacterium sp.]|uniref:MaoC family dehydratase n=1 Tax=Aquabacterium sp. TaxID=1872578 RepID=UPI001D970F96|nr:MaoC family dehydratase [Aquabacterium sp.]MBT9609122.1 MaoC family dehydratase [Aquabacterium sp.]
MSAEQHSSHATPQPSSLSANPDTARTDVRWHWEDLHEGLCLTFGPKIVARDEVIRFATDFDPQPFHLSEEAGKASLFGGLAASGWHTAGMVMRLMCDGFLLNASSLGSPGLDSLKWLKPVMVGDEIRARMTILGTRPMKSKAHVGLVQSRWEAINQRDEVVMVIESWAMFGRREAAKESHAAGL